MKFFNFLGCIVLLVMLGCGGSGGESSTLGSVFPASDSVSTPPVVAPSNSGKISGRVTDDSGKPLSDVNVDFFTDTDSYLGSQLTDSNGNYIVTGFATGTYKVGFNKLGYTDIWFGGATSLATASLVTVTSPGTISGIDGVMGIGGKISGLVTDASGAPMDDVYVDIFTGTDSYLGSQLTSGGNYTVTGFATGTYKVIFQKMGYADVWYNGAINQSTASLVTVTSTGTTTGIDGVMGVGGTISGCVTDASGNPISEVYVDFFTGTDSYLGSQLTDSNGNYIVTGFATGTYKVGFNKSGYTDIWFSGATSLATASPVTVTSPATTSGINGVL